MIFSLRQSSVALTSSLLLASSLASKPFMEFEGDGYGSWSTEGKAFGKAVVAGATTPSGEKVTQYSQAGFASSLHHGPEATGSLKSPKFVINDAYIHFLIAGGNSPSTLALQLLIDGKVVLSESGSGDATFRPKSWDVSQWKNRQAQLQVIDNDKGALGFIFLDHIVLSAQSNHVFPPMEAQSRVDKVSLTPSKIIPEISIPTGSSLQLIGDHNSHGITSPTALTVTADGNILITETERFMDEHGIDDNRNRLYWLEQDLASQTTDDRLKMYKSWYHKHPAEHYTQHDDRVRLLYDSNDDKTIDANKVYAEGFNSPLDGTAAGIFSFKDTVYLACIPHIWALSDNDGDGVSDERRSLQDGFGPRVSFSGHDLNGFAIGPDGRLYATVGDRGLNFTTKEGRQYKLPNQGAIVRFEPDGSNMEVIHTGLRNPKEIAFDQYGNGITVDNNSDQGDKARVVYIVEGGDSGWRMGHQVLHSFHRTVGIENHPINRWMAEKMWQPQHPSQPSFILPPLLNLTSGPSGLTYDPGTGAHPAAVNKFLVCDYRGAGSYSQIVSFGIEPKGAGMSVTDHSIFSKGSTVTDLEYGYNGQLYITDFMGGWSTHKAGRVYSITADKNQHDKQIASVAELIKSGIHTLPSDSLAKLLAHPDSRIRLRAQIALVERKEVDLFAKLYDSFSAKKQLVPSLHAIWGLGSIARKSPELASRAGSVLIKIYQQSDSDEQRSQAVKFLGECPKIDELPATLDKALRDPSERVQSFAALALARHPDIVSVDSVIAFADTNKSADPYLRHAAVMALSAQANRQELISLTNHPSDAVRLTAALVMRRTKDPMITLFLSDRSLHVRAAAIRAIHDQQQIALQPQTAALLDKVDSVGNYTEMMQRRLIHSAYRVGGTVNIKRLINFAMNDSYAPEQRKEAMRLLSIWQNPPSVDRSTGCYAPLSNRAATPITTALKLKIRSLLASDSFIVEHTLNLVAQYKIIHESVSPESLAALALDETLESGVRSAAVLTLAKLSAQTLLEIAPQLIKSEQSSVAIEALNTLFEHTPQQAIPAIIAATNSPHISVRQNGWRLIGQTDSAVTDKHLIKAIDELAQSESLQASAIEILEAAQNNQSPKVRVALTSYVESTNSQPLGKWSSSLFGGDARRGRELFKSHGSAQCMRCHAVGYGHEAGGNAGPNLAGVANKHKRSTLLESLIRPSAHIADGFGTATITFTEGTTLTSPLVKSDADSLTIKQAKNLYRIPRTMITNVSLLPSAMPSMDHVLNPRQLRDVVAYLASLDQLTQPSDRTETPALPFTEALLKLQSTSDPALPKQFKQGKDLYLKHCSMCHQNEGQGLKATFPPLADSEWVRGPIDNLIRIQLRGLQGPIHVKGEFYQGVMPANSTLSDREIADILSYVRYQFGKKSSPVSASEVKKWRKEVGQPPLTNSDLTKP